jgi:site-specific DNA-cytosine methylase
MPKLKLTDANYYSPEANWAYMSTSQFKSFRKCEAAALAELRGEWNRPSSTALLVGSYVDAYFSGEMEQFKAAHPEMYKKDGALKADFEKAEAVNSNTQLYKQAGNSIVVNVLQELFKMMLDENGEIQV